jgi:hypothetical protein
VLRARICGNTIGTEPLDLVSGHSLWWDMSNIPFGADTVACARPAAPVKAGHSAAPTAGSP